MPSPTKTQVESVVLDGLARLRRQPSIEIRPDQSLLEFVDSFGFVNLLLEIEADLGLELDLSQVDLADIVVFGGLIGFIQEKGGRGDLGHDPVGVLGSCRPERPRMA